MISLTTKNIIIAGIVIVACYYIYKKIIKKEGYEDSTAETVETSSKTINPDDINGSELDAAYEEGEAKSEEIVESPKIKSDLSVNWSDKADSEYKHSSYVDGVRGNDETVLDALDSYDSQLAENVDYSLQSSNDKFAPVDESKGKYSAYKQNHKKQFSTDEIFDNDKLLPQEMNKDWFEYMPEPIKVKNRHLINIAKPGAGIDTVGSSKRNATHDIRGDIVNPKFVVAPWNQSSIQPDVNTVGFCNRSPYN